MAGLLAETGFTASLDAFEHRQGFFEVFNGPGNYTPRLALEHWASPLDIVEPGIGIKLYPCCDSTHASLDALFSLRREQPFDAAHVARIEVFMHPLRLTHVNRPQLRNSLDAKFSVQYCLARALLDGHIVLDSFSDSALNDSEALALMPLIHAQPHPTPSMAEPGNYLTELRVMLLDGQCSALTLQHPYGRTKAQPAPLQSIMTKFQHNAAKALNDHDAANLTETVMTMERLSDASVIGRLCAAS